MTPVQFRKRAERVFRAGNPGCRPEIKWTHGPVAVVWHDGTPGMSGTFVASADGYRTRTMHASLLDGNVGVR